MTGTGFCRLAEAKSSQIQEFRANIEEKIRLSGPLFAGNTARNVKRSSIYRRKKHKQVENKCISHVFSAINR